MGQLIHKNMGLILCIVYVVLISPPRSMFSGCKVDVVPDPELRYAEGANFLRGTRAEISNSKDISRCVVDIRPKLRFLCTLF